jgi:dTDP-4-amino-4,6-dideoxygalactose transaminase
MANPVLVTQPSLAPLSEFIPYLESIWRSGVMTHNGPFLQQLERELAVREGLKDLVCVANGTCALQLAIRALDLTGEIITTPFSFIATANIIAWERCTPVFADIDPHTWNLDPTAIEAAITDRTSAILPVHVFSAPCDLVAIKEIADQHHLKVIYDAAHAMCVRSAGRSVMAYGDISCTSFHATKLFTTCEGGACFSREEELNERIRRMRFFGFNAAKEIVDDGMNAKMTEIAAALGLANLKHLDEVRKRRRAAYELYLSLLSGCDYLSFQQYHRDEYNYSYMPVLFDCEDRLLRAMDRLAKENIYPRRYFHPSLSDVRLLGGRAMPVARSIASRIACMPLYHQLGDDAICRICTLVAHDR